LKGRWLLAPVLLIMSLAPPRRGAGGHATREPGEGLHKINQSSGCKGELVLVHNRIAA